MTKPRLSLLVSTHTFLPVVGGAELGIHEIYNRLGQHHRVTILTPRPPQTEMKHYGADDYGTANYDVVHLAPRLDRVRPTIVGRGLRRTSLPYLVHLASLARQMRVDVINFHYLVPHGAAMIVMRRVFRIPALLSLVGRSDVLSELSWPRRLYARLVIANSDLVAPNSDMYLGESYTGPKVDVIPYGVDTAQFSPGRRDRHLRRRLGVRDDQLLLFTVQRLASVKRVDVLIRVMGELKRRGEDAVLVVGGQGEEADALRALATKLEVDDRVRFVGYIPSTALPDYFASADAFVFHSLFETFGIVFAQAMASGLPIVAPTSSCVAGVVEPENGIFVRPFDIPGFADAIVTLAADRDHRAAIGKGNRLKAVREFNWDSIAARYERVLIRLAEPQRFS